MKSFILSAVLLVVSQAVFAQHSGNDTLWQNGDLFLRRDLRQELHLVEAHLDTAQQAHAHDEWTYYLNRPNPAVATVRSYFAQAAREFRVPQRLLETIGQVENNWTQIGPSIDQGWGIMHLVENDYCHTLPEAAALLGLSEQTLKDDAAQNIRGAAALLRKYFDETSHPSDRLEDWYPAVKRFSGLIDDELQTQQADRYYTVLNDGSVSQTLWDETILLPRHKDVDFGYIAAHFKKTTSPRGVQSADYPPAQASFTTCNYTATRNHSIDTWVNHWIGTGTAAGAVSWFKNCSAQASAHFVTANNGTIYQVVPVASAAWHCGASGYPYNNGRSIGEEHEATVANPSLWNSTAMLQASAQMACYFSGIYSIPTNQNHTSPGICGHQNMPGTNTDCPGTIPWSVWFGYFNSGNCNAQPAAQPANDYCGNAVALPVYGANCGTAADGDVNGATQSAAAAMCDGYASTNAKDVWFTFVATAQAHDITVTPSGGLDAVVDLRTACPGSTIDCEDSGGGEGAVEVLHATGLTIGTTYYVRVYDYTGANNPPSTTAFTICITTPCSTPLKPLITGNGTFCSGTTSTLQVSNPCSGCTYHWSNGNSGQQTAVSVSGNYRVTAVNACGSVSSDNFNVAVTPKPQAVIGNLSNAYCRASADVALVLTPQGGTLTGAGIYGTVFSPSSLSTGTYVITYAVVQNGCADTTFATTLITATPSVHISASGASSFCSGDSVWLTATQGTAYNWSNGATTPSIAVTQSGVYGVTVQNPGGCNAAVPADSAAVVTVFSRPTASAGADQNFVLQPSYTITLGGTPSASGGTPPYSYLWSPPDALNADSVANPEVSGLPHSLTYVLRVSDAHGCRAFDTVTVTTVPACTYTPVPNYLHFSAQGEVDSLYLYVSDTGCAAWSVMPCSWLTVLAPVLPHKGDAYLVLSAAPNTDTLPRSCVFAPNNTTNIIIEQDGAFVDPCLPPLLKPNVQVNFCDLAADIVPNVSYQWYQNGVMIPGATSRFYTVSQSAYYYVLVADANFCSAQSDDLYIAYPACGGTDISELDADADVQIFPNPAAEESVALKIPERALPATICMRDITGRLVLQQAATQPQTTVAVAPLLPGVYLLTVEAGRSFTATKRFIKY